MPPPPALALLACSVSRSRCQHHRLRHLPGGVLRCSPTGADCAVRGSSQASPYSSLFRLIVQLDAQMPQLLQQVCTEMTPGKYMASLKHPQFVNKRVMVSEEVRFRVVMRGVMLVRSASELVLLRCRPIWNSQRSTCAAFGQILQRSPDPGRIMHKAIMFLCCLPLAGGGRLARGTSSVIVMGGT